MREYKEFLGRGRARRPLAGGGFAHGVLPPGFFRQLRDRLLALAAERAPRRVHRTE